MSFEELREIMTGLDRQYSIDSTLRGLEQRFSR